MFNVKTGNHKVLYIQIIDNKIEKTIDVPDTGLQLDFNKDNQLVGIESIQRDEDFPDEWLEEAGLK